MTLSPAPIAVAQAPDSQGLRNPRTTSLSQPAALGRARVLLLLILAFLPIAQGAGLNGLEMILDGQLLRRAPHPPTGLLSATQTVDRVELNIPDGAANFVDRAGLFAFSNERGSFAITAATSPSTTTNLGSVKWHREFTKLPDEFKFHYTVNPSRLRLVTANADPTNHFLASWQLIVRVNGQTNMYSERVIEGFARPFGPTAFGLTTNTGPVETHLWDNDSLHEATYTTVRYRGELDLSGIDVGQRFTLEYEMNTRLIDTLGRETGTEVYIGDPLKYGSGVQMNYGTFGELFFLHEVTFDPVLGAVLTIPDDPGFYYILCRRIGFDGSEVPVAMSLGAAGLLIDPHPPTNVAAIVLYLAKKVPLDQPLDSDGDGIDDVYELLHGSILDPLDSRDAFEDPDADGVRNLAEYLAGTDPTTPDASTTPVVQFPGLVIPSYPGGRLIDLNNDGLLDSASRLSVALANPGGTFQAPTNSSVPGVLILSDARQLNLDSDPFPDAVAISILTNRVFVLRGNGDGTFTHSGDYPAFNGPSQIVLGHLNTDRRPDIALMSANGRGADLFFNHGDGTLTPFATVTTNAYGTARSLALGDVNDDGLDDVIVGYAANIAVFLNLTNSFSPALAYPAGSSPNALALGDLNQDGWPDLVAANGSSDDLSILLAAGNGTFLPQARLPIGDNPNAIWIANLNADSFPDVIISRVSTEYQTVLLGRGDGTLLDPSLVPTGASLVEVLDWDGDGELDLISGVSSGGLINFGNGDGTFATRLQIVPTNSPPTQVRPVDLNGDNRLELVGLNTTANSIEIWEHPATDPLAGSHRLLASVVVGPTVAGWAHGDFNGDGRIDLAVATQTNRFSATSSHQIVVLTNVGGFVFADAGHYPFTLGPSLLVTGDLDGDGDLDLAAQLGGGTLIGGSRVVALLGNGAGGFTPGTPTHVGDTLSFLEATDIEADSRSELVLRGSRTSGAQSGGFLEVYAYDAASTGWTRQQTLVSTNSIGSQQILRWDGDAYPDLVVSDTEGLTGRRSLRLFPGGPTGFGAQQLIENDLAYFGFTRLADLNADGLIDLIFGNALSLGKAGGGFHASQSIWISSAGVQQVADFNRDGKLDLMSGLAILLQENP